MLWAGGAVKAPQKVERICSQTDIAATLLGQLQTNYSVFRYSKNLFNPTCKEYAFYDFPDGFGLITPEGHAVYDCSAGNTLMSSGERTDSLIIRGKAFLQYLYQDIDRY
jgi:membrane-anchored protein YejM (alkaline phosphatase superfamily)